METRTITLSQNTSSDDSRVTIRNKLYSTIDSIDEGITQGQVIQLKLQMKSQKRRLDNDNDEATPNTIKTTTLQYPNLDSTQAYKFLKYYKTIKTVYELLKGNTRLTKRQLFYSDVELYQRQDVIDDIIDNLAKCFNVSIEKLNVLGSPKGMIAVNFPKLMLNYKQEQVFEFNSGQEYLIPLISLDSTYEDFRFSTSPTPATTAVDEIWILEKHAIFSKINAEIQHHPLNIVLITGKGFPDRLTKTFTNFLTLHHPQAKVRGFVDSDVYGLSIFRQYNCERMIYEGVKLLQSRTGERVKYLGIKKRDRVLMKNLLACLVRTEQDEDENGEQLKRELQLGMFLHVKKELD